MSVGKSLQPLLVFLILNGMYKTKQAILPFLCCEEIVKNSTGLVNWPRVTRSNLPSTIISYLLSNAVQMAQGSLK